MSTRVTNSVPADFEDEASAIVAVLTAAAAAVEAGRVDGLLAMFRDDPDTFLYDYMPPRTYDLDGLRRSFTAMTGDLDGAITCEVVECRVYPLGQNAAWSAALMHVVAPLRSGRIEITYRATDIWMKTDGRWKAVHEHASVPVDPVSGQADLTSSD